VQVYAKSTKLICMNVLTKLCYYDTRNPDSVVFGLTDEQADEQGYLTKAVYDKFNTFCQCDNCYYGRTELAEYALSLEKALADRERRI